MPKQGRPAGDGKRVPLNMRTTKEVREMLENAAAASGRSLVQEVECRLERSFADDRIAALESKVDLLLARVTISPDVRRALDELLIVPSKPGFEWYDKSECLTEAGRNS